MYFLVQRQIAVLDEIKLPTIEQVRTDLNAALTAVGAAKADEAAKKAARTAAEDTEKASRLKLAERQDAHEEELLRQIDDRWPAASKANAA